MRRKYFPLILFFFISSIAFTNPLNQVSSYENTIKNDLINISALNNGERSNSPPPSNILYKEEGEIYGSILNHAQKPIPDALIKFSITGISPESADQKECKTDKEGKFEIKYSISYNSGTPLYNLKVSAKDYLENEIKNTPLYDNYQRIYLEFKNGGKVIGKVVKKSTSEPVADAQVDLNGAMSSQIKTDANGTFQINYIIPGDYYFYAQKDSLKQKEVTRFSISENEIKDNIIIELEETYTVTGKVVDKDTNKPVANLLLSAYGCCKNNDVVTREDGVYVFENVSSDLYINIISDTYIAAEPKTEKWGDKKIILKDNYYIDNQDIYVKQGLKIKGAVSTFDNKPVFQAEIEVIKADSSSKKYRVDPSGRFTFALEPGTHFRIIASSNNYASTISPEYFAKDSPIEDIILILKNGGTIEGKVLSDKNLPLSEIGVSSDVKLQLYNYSCYRNSRCTNTDEEGKFILKNIMPGTVILTAQSRNLNIAKRLEIKLGEDKNITDLIIILSKGLSISGKILNENNEPLEGITISANNYGRSSFAEIKTDVDGHYEFKGLIDDYFSLSVRDESNKYIEEKKDHIQSGSTDVNFILKKKMNQIISGKVIDIKTFNPINKFKISHNGKEYEFNEANGLFTLQEPITIPTRITVSAQDYLPEEYSVKEKQKEHIFPLSKGGAIKGRTVSKIDNKPIEGAEISTKVNGRDKVKTCSNTAGEFIISDLPYSGYWFDIKAKGFIDKRINVMAWERETNNIGDIYLGTGCKIYGRVYDENNQVCKNVVLLVQNADLMVPYERLSYETITNEVGYYEFKGLPMDKYLISGKILDAIHQEVELKDENEEKQIDFHLTGTAVKINVMMSGEGFADATIEAESEKSNFKGKTDFQGNFFVKGVKGGSYDLYILYNNSTVWIEAIEIKEDAKNNLTFNVSDSCVSGRFLNKDGKLIGNVPIGLFFKKLEYYDKEVCKKVSYCVTDSSGCFAFRYVPPGEYILGATAAWSPSIDNNDCAIMRVLINFGEDIENIDLKIGEGRLFEFIIKDSQTNQPLPFTNVSIRFPFIHTQANTDGKVWLWGFPPDTYKFGIYNRDYEPFDEEITIGEEQTIQKEILLNKK